MTKKRSANSFDSDDFAYLYISSLKDFAESLGFKIPKNINPSWLIHNFQKKYQSHLINLYTEKSKPNPQRPWEDTDDQSEILSTLKRTWYWRNPTEIGRHLYSLGIIDFDLIEPESKNIFAEHSGLIKSIQKILRLPKGISLSITEPEPYSLKFDFKRNISEATKLRNLPSDFITFHPNSYTKDFLKVFEEYTGIENTRITKGGYEYDYDIEEIGFKDILDLFIKNLKREIKTSEFVDFIKGIKISNENLDRNNLINLDFLIKNAGNYSWYHRSDRARFAERWEKFKSEFVPKVAMDMGHPGLISLIGIDSPTARRL